MINMQERALLEQIKSRSKRMIVTAVCLADSYEPKILRQIKIYIENTDRQISSEIELKTWIESLYYDGSLKVHNDMSDELYLLLTNKFFNREMVIEITQDGNTGHVTSYATIDY
jgi:hypothetical protein